MKVENTLPAFVQWCLSMIDVCLVPAELEVEGKPQATKEVEG